MMVTEKKEIIRHKPISGQIHEHHGFELLADGNMKDADKDYCIHGDKSFAYRGSNTSLTYHFQNKHSLQYSKLQLAMSPTLSQLTAASSST